MMRWSEKFKWALAFAVWAAVGVILAKKLIGYLYC